MDDYVKTSRRYQIAWAIAAVVLFAAIMAPFVIGVIATWGK